MGAGIDSGSTVSACRCRVRVRLVREALQPARTSGIGPAPVRDQMRGHTPARDVQQVEARRARRQREVRNGDDIPVFDRLLVLLQCCKRTLQQCRIDASGDPSASGRALCECGRYQAAECGPEKPTTRALQIDLRPEQSRNERTTFTTLDNLDRRKTRTGIDDRPRPAHRAWTGDDSDAVPRR